jgi:hypothetical protein
MLLLSRWLESRLGWLILLILLSEALLWRWFDSDNHQFLLVYWVLAVYLALLFRLPDDSWRTVARQLLVAAFGAAFAWKVVGGEYFDGSFWEGTLITDPRLAAHAVVVGGLPSTALASNADAVADLLAAERSEESVDMVSTPRMRVLGLALSWVGLLMEGGVATLLMLSREGLARTIALFSLGSFLLAVYVWLPVYGFAWLIGLLALAQMEERERLAYGGMLLVVSGLFAVDALSELVFAAWL